MSVAHGIAESCIQYKDNPVDGASANDTFYLLIQPAKIVLLV